MTVALAVHGIAKSFGYVQALRETDLHVEEGEVHALLGENGAGKSTLMNIANGMFLADRGELKYFGRIAAPASPAEAAALGIGMVHQHFRLVESFSVAENVHLGWEVTPHVLSQGELERRTGDLAERFGFAVDPGAKIWQLAIAQKQQVAILKVLARGARIIVLDEPTSVLAPQEANALFENLRRMKEAGRTVIYISHKLSEVMTVSDRISILRRGQRVATITKEEAEAEHLVRLMIGRDLTGKAMVDDATPIPRMGALGGPVVVATGLRAIDDREAPALRDVDLTISAGEIVGIASVGGNGARELVEVLVGIRLPVAGEVRVGRTYARRGLLGSNPTRGIGHIPEENSIGLAMGATIEANAVMRFVDGAGARRGYLLDRHAMRRYAKSLVKDANLADISIKRRADTLSGGQGQRLIIRRELEAGTDALIAAYPSRGLDVEGIARVQSDLIAARERGIAVLVLSEDLDELFRLSDRILVVYEGRIVGQFNAEAFDRERIGMFMTTGHEIAGVGRDIQ